MAAEKLPATLATLDRVFHYRDGSQMVWISFRTADGFLETERRAIALRSFALAQAAISHDTGVVIFNPRYANPEVWEADVQAALFRGLR